MSRGCWRARRGNDGPGPRRCPALQAAAKVSGPLVGHRPPSSHQAELTWTLTLNCNIFSRRGSIYIMYCSIVYVLYNIFILKIPILYYDWIIHISYLISYPIPPLQIMFRKVLEYFLHLTSYNHQPPPTKSLAILTSGHSSLLIANV